MAGKAIPPLRPGMIDLWRIDLDELLHSDAAPFPLLSRAEAARAARFQRPELSRRFEAAHRALRAVLRHYSRLGEAAGESGAGEFDLGSHGKPFLSGRPELHFNLSHSTDLALIAVSGEGEVGVDCEAVDPRIDLAGLVAESFSAVEKEAWERTPPVSRRAAFYRAWTRKEAYLKATGTGLARPPADFSVSLAENPGEAWLDDPAGGGSWSLADLPLGKTHVGALVAESRGQLRLFHPEPPHAIRKKA